MSRKGKCNHQSQLVLLSDPAVFCTFLSECRPEKLSPHPYQSFAGDNMTALHASQCYLKM
uniref:Uncharacterized protein n=1 Tax=Strix occidentalis caurina TaxID=311401 RepID=A0A8D0EIN3_STROC